MVGRWRLSGEGLENVVDLAIKMQTTQEEEKKENAKKGK